MAFKELTWLLRSIGVKSKINVDKNGSITIQHQFQDIFDLRPSDDGSRSYAYDMVSIITGFVYHDVAGGNDMMKIKGKWSNHYTVERAKFMAMTEEELAAYKKEQWNSAKEIIKNNPRYDSNKW